LEAWDGTVNSPQLEELVMQLEKTVGPAPNPHVPQEEYRRTQEFFTKLLEYDTGHISTIVRLIRKNNELVGGYLFRANNRACRFYDIAPDFDEISGSDLIEILRSWVNENDLELFLEDQIRISNNLILGRECQASVPIRFTNQHPYEEFRDQSFMPIVVSFSGKFAIDDHVEELLAITYINLSNLCKSI
jgi:hypothetical protein